MQYPILLDWASQNAILSVFLSIPTAWVLVCMAASFANTVTTMWSTAASFLVSMGSVLTVWIRGYPPVDPEPARLTPHPDLGPDSASDERGQSS